MTVYSKIILWNQSWVRGILGGLPFCKQSCFRYIAKSSMHVGSI